MSRIPVFIACFFAIILPPSVYALQKSNAIGQDLGPADGDSGYTMSVDAGNTTLYKDGVPIMKLLQEKTSGGDTVSIRQDLDAGTQERLVIAAGNLMQEETDGNKTVFVHASDGKVISSRTLKGEVLLSFTRYYYDKDGNLSLTITKDNTDKVTYASFSTEGQSHVLLVASGSDSCRRTVARGTTIASTQWKGEDEVSGISFGTDKDGSFSLTDKISGKKEYYSSEGLLERSVQTDTDGLTTTSYERNAEGTVVSKTEEEVSELPDGGTTIRQQIYSYEAGQLVQQKNSLDGNLISLTAYKDGVPQSKILYAEGKAYCTLQYEEDGKTLKSIDYASEGAK
ncbi:MAG: hypothetical protein LKE40_01650 [Spirochaetia bacterium]|jgi:hypothetical protein|nr:hypothetical protein [Spirochaetia bacterium]